MSSLAEIQAQIDALQEKANLIKNREKEGIIAELREKIKTYDLTAADLGLNVPEMTVVRRAPRGTKVVAKPEPKYRDAHGNEWSGGRGRRPQWVIAAMEAGEDLENYRIAE
ncbi:MAG: H-NS histone family protein [Chromatiaceae bacterium]